MTIQDLGSFGELVSGVAVLVTLIYLIVQLRQNTATIRAQTRGLLTQQSIRVQSLLLENPHVAEVVAKSRKGEVLDDREELIDLTRCFVWFRHWENVHYQYRQGLYDEAEYLAQRRAIAWRMNEGDPALRRVWAGVKQRYSPDFVEEMESVIAEPA